MIGNRIKELQRTLKIKTQKEFAKALGVTPTHISTAIKGKSGVSALFITAVCLRWNVNRQWLETGKGKMFLTEKHENNVIQYNQSPLAEALKERVVAYQTKVNSKEHLDKLQQMIVALIDIMESENNTVKTAIESNLVAFQYTVQSDKKMERFEQEIKELKRIIKTDFETRKLQRAGAARIKGGKN